MVNLPLAKLKLLKKDIEKRGWVIDSFKFEYKSQKYIVLVKLYIHNEIKPPLALLKLEFMRAKNINDSLEVPANIARLLVDAKTLCRYFGIEYSENLGCILQEFSANLGRFIPEVFSENKSLLELHAIEHSLSKSDSTDPNKRYCYMVKRNGIKHCGTLKQRSLYNDNITRIRRPSLYARLCADTNISFCYSCNKSDEKSDEEILANWANNK